MDKVQKHNSFNRLKVFEEKVLKRGKGQQSGENCIMRSFINYTFTTYY
jgi:hypothetical protein